MTVKSSEALNAEQSQIYILPVSASTSDIQGINIKLINENLGDKIMFFFLMIPRFSHLTKNEQTFP